MAINLVFRSRFGATDNIMPVRLIFVLNSVIKKKGSTKVLSQITGIQVQNAIKNLHSLFNIQVDFANFVIILPWSSHIVLLNNVQFFYCSARKG